MKHALAMWIIALSSCGLLYNFSDYTGLRDGGSDPSPGGGGARIVFMTGPTGASTSLGGAGGTFKDAAPEAETGADVETGSDGAGGAPGPASSVASSSSGPTCALPPPGACDCFVQPKDQWICPSVACQYTCPFCHPGPPWPECTSAGVIPGTQTWAACCGSH